MNPLIGMNVRLNDRSYAAVMQDGKVIDDSILFEYYGSSLIDAKIIGMDYSERHDVKYSIEHKMPVVLSLPDHPELTVCTTCDMLIFPPPVKHMKDIPMGQAFRAHLQGRDTELYLRIYTGVVSLTNPQVTWTDTGSVMYAGPDFLDYKPVTLLYKTV